MTDKALKPCMKCEDGEPFLYYNMIVDFYFIECDQCGNGGGYGHESEEEAINIWNEKYFNRHYKR